MAPRLPTHTLKLSSKPEVRRVESKRLGDILEVIYTAVPLEGKGGKVQKVDLLELDPSNLQKILAANPTPALGKDGLPEKYTMQRDKEFVEWKIEEVLEWGKTLELPPDDEEDGYTVDGIGGLRVQQKVLQAGTVWGNYDYSTVEGEHQITWNSVEAIAGAPELVSYYLGSFLLNDVEIRIEAPKAESPKNTTKVNKAGARKGVKKGGKEVGRARKAEKPNGKSKKPRKSGKQMAKIIGYLSLGEQASLAEEFAKNKKVCNKVRIANNNNNKWD